MRNVLVIFLAALSLVHVVPVICTQVGSVHSQAQVKQRRAADTCADPNLADVFVIAYSPSNTWHALHPRWNFVSVNTQLGEDWQIQGPVFIAWQTAQEFTVGLWQLANFETLDLMFLPVVNNTTPFANGFTGQGAIGFVYDTEICGSVPLLGAFNQAAGDHFYTTSAAEHSGLLSDSWVDAPTGAFVLPIPSDGAWSIN